MNYKLYTLENNFVLTIEKGNADDATFEELRDSLKNEKGVIFQRDYTNKITVKFHKILITIILDAIIRKIKEI